MDGELEARICDGCDHVVVNDGGIWQHPDWVSDKFSGAVCEKPAVGRPAKPGELRFGRGRTVSREDFSHHSALDDFSGEPGTRLLLATDGSYKKLEGHIRNRPICWGYVTDRGHYGLGGKTLPPNIAGLPVLQTELRAMWHALNRFIPRHVVHLLTDSLDALELIELWRQGSGQMPPGYTVERQSQNKATLVQLARLVAANADRISIDKVQAHTGHALNEGADALAKIARVWATGRISKQTAHADARTVVRQTIARQRAGSHGS